MARLLNQLAVGETVTIQETGGPAQYYVGQQNYSTGYSGNPSGQTFLVRANKIASFSYVTDPQNESDDSLRYPNTNIATRANNFLNTISEPIKSKINPIYHTVAYRRNTVYNYGQAVALRVIPFSIPFHSSGWSYSSYQRAWIPLENFYATQTIYNPSPINATLARTIIENNAVDSSEYIVGYGWYHQRNLSGQYGGLLGGFYGPVDNYPYLYTDSVNTGTTVTIIPCFCVTGSEVKVSLANELYVGPYDTTFSNIPQIAMQGQPITVNWNASNDATGYILQRSINGGSSWETVYTGANLDFTETVDTSWTQLQYQVCATSDEGSSPYVNSGAIEVVTSQSLLISGTDGNLGTLTSDIHYTVSSNTGNQINLTRTVNGVVAASQTVDSGFSYDIPILELPSGDNNTIVISASVATTGGNVVNAVRNWTYSKMALEFPNDVGISTLTQNGENIYPMSTMEAIRTYGFMGGTLDKTLMELANAGSVISGSYVGTGVYGATNPNSVTLPFVPKAFIVGSNTNTTENGPLIWLLNATQGTNADKDPVNFTVNNTQISWYYTANASVQCNTNGMEYSWIAIG